MSAFFTSNKKQLAVLIDPDKQPITALHRIAHLALANTIDAWLVGGSLLSTANFEATIQTLKSLTPSIPVFIFPGNALQVSAAADGILLLSLISGRNADFLIGQHVVAALSIQQAKLKTQPTGYILVDGGSTTSVQYMSGTVPIPSNKNDIAVATALAGQQLGMQSIYLEAGSGAETPVPESMIRAVKQTIEVPLIVGGGIRNAAQSLAAFNAGADVVVVGTAFEHELDLLTEIAATR